MSGLRIPTTNENWQGKNDPAERRRIQNRINQRAYRERQRAGESQSTRQLCSRPMSSAPSPSMESQPDDDDDDEDEDEDDSDEESDDDDDEESDKDGDDSNPSPPNSQQQPPASQAPNPWDELARLINRNFLNAIATNARHLSLSPTSLQSGAPTLTPRPPNPSTIPVTLRPLEIQHTLPHDPLIDTIPHPRLRYNILRAISTRALDPAKFSACLRRSGAVTVVQGDSRRVGLIVWREPEVVSSWEVGEAFVIVWGWLLEGCEDLVAATNFWRGRRGERALSIR